METIDKSTLQQASQGLLSVAMDEKETIYLLNKNDKEGFLDGREDLYSLSSEGSNDNATTDDNEIMSDLPMHDKHCVLYLLFDESDNRSSAMNRNIHRSNTLNLIMQLPTSPLFSSLSKRRKNCKPVEDSIPLTSSAWWQVWRGMVRALLVRRARLEGGDALTPAERRALDIEDERARLRARYIQ
ncbi:Protein of unknown function, partial [Gryllus bimaculatus]